MNPSERLNTREVLDEEWRQLWSQVGLTNLLQSWEYGQAKSKSEGWVPIRLVFEDKLKNPVAIAQILTKTIPVLGGFARLNRGPLMLNTNGFVEVNSSKLEVMRCLKKIARERRWWFFYAAPEIMVDQKITEKDLIKIGFKERSSNSAWGSSLIYLHREEEELLAGLKGKWRNLLRKSFKSNLVVENKNCIGNELDLLINLYREVQVSNKFTGLSSELVRSLSEQNSEDWKFNYYTAHDSECSQLAGLLVCIQHGQTATYLIGITTELGRKTNANYNLLWNAIIDSKYSGCKWFDLGGLNENTPRGVRHFKEGLQGEIYNLIGEYRS